MTIGLNSYVTKYLRISSYIESPSSYMTLHPIPSEFLYMRKIIFFISVRTYRLIFWSSDSLCGDGTLLATGTESSSAFKYPHCNENPIYAFPEKEIARPQSQLPHSCVCERLIYSQDRSTYFLAADRFCRYIWIAHRLMNVEIGTKDAQFLFWEYLFRIFGIAYLQSISHF
jgi:hypothetical protein